MCKPSKVPTFEMLCSITLLHNGVCWSFSWSLSLMSSQNGEFIFLGLPITYVHVCFVMRRKYMQVCNFSACVITNNEYL